MSDSQSEYELPEDPVARGLDQAFAASKRWLDPAMKIDITLKNNGVDPSSEMALPARLATGYFLDFPSGTRSRVELASMQFYGDRPAITPKDHDQSIANAWARWAEETPLRALQARLHDLLAQRGGRMVPTHAHRAVEAYCDLAENPNVGVSVEGDYEVVTWEPAELDLALARALALLNFNPKHPEDDGASETLPGRVVSLVLARLMDLSSTGEMSGIFGMLAEQLTRDRSRLLPDQVGELEAALGRVFDSAVDPVLIDRLGVLLLRLGSRQPAEIGTRRVRVRMERGADSPPMVGMSFLQQAQNLARDLGLAALADEATRRMQSLRLSDFDWKVVSTEATIGRELMEAQIRRWSFGATAMEALNSWGLAHAPTGDYAFALQEARQRASANRITNTISRVIYGADGLPQFTVTTLAERVLYELSVSDQLAFQLNGQLLADALDEVARFGVPDKPLLLDWLTGDGGEDARTPALKLAEGLNDYWRKDYEAAAARSIPQIETALRQLVLMFNEPAYVATRQGARGKYVGIDQLLTLLQSYDLDPDWDHAIRAFCLGPYGLNVRHDYAHGFSARLPPRLLAALSLRILLLLVRMGGRPDNTPRLDSHTVPVPSITRAVAHTLRYASQDSAARVALLQREVRDLREVIRSFASRALLYRGNVRSSRVDHVRDR